MRCLPLLPMLLGLAACGDPVVAESYLAVRNISPSGGSAGVSLDTDVVVTFSEALRSATISSDNFYLLDDGGSAVDADLSSTDETVLLAPTDLLFPDTTYEVVLAAGLSGVNSGPLATEIRSSFTTEGGAQTENELPVAVVEQPGTVLLGDTVALDGSGSYDPEGADLVFTWSVVSAPGGAAAEIADAFAPVTSIQPDAVGAWIIGLVVDDGVAESSEAYAQFDVE